MNPRAAWVDVVNSGLIAPITDEACLPLTRDGLMGEAIARAGGSFGDDVFVEPLDLLLRSLEEEAELTIVGRWMTRRFLLRLLQVRLQLMRYVRDDPGVVDEEIRAPLFITGLPRTGTTLLHGVLARDPRLRAPTGWELLFPVPPPVTDDDPARAALAETELRMLATVVPDMDVIHEYGARLPKECLSAHSFEFRSEEFTARYHVPSYEKWLLSCDMTPAYEMHRRVLQILQRRRSARWVLKSPVHLHLMPTVLAVYPDARFVVTHRDLNTVLGSATSLVTNLRWVHSDAPVAPDLAPRYSESLARLAAFEQDHPGVVHHVRYDHVVRDLLGEIRSTYDALDLELTTAAEELMRAELAARPQGKHGVHEYRPYAG